MSRSGYIRIIITIALASTFPLVAAASVGAPLGVQLTTAAVVAATKPTRRSTKPPSTLSSSNIPILDSDETTEAYDIDLSSWSSSLSLYGKWHRTVPEPFRFFVSGNIGSIFFFLLDSGVHSLLCSLPKDFLPSAIQANKDAVSFFVGYLIQIWMQHFLNALLVYGLGSINTKEKYISTLRGQYSAYMFALFGSTALNIALSRAGFNKKVAFVLTMSIFACINYVVIGWTVKRANKATKKITISIPRGGGSICESSVRNFQKSCLLPKLLEMVSPYATKGVLHFPSP